MKQLLLIFVLSCSNAFVYAQTQGSVTTNRDSIFINAEVAPAFDGGLEAWGAFVRKNIKTQWPKSNPAGVFTVMVQFIVQRDGSLTDVKALTTYGYGMEKEAVRVIKLTPRWIPAKQNGQDVASYVKQPITFVIE